jgi:hypothetical protein
MHAIIHACVLTHQQEDFTMRISAASRFALL